MRSSHLFQVVSHIHQDNKWTALRNDWKRDFLLSPCVGNCFIRSGFLIIVGILWKSCEDWKIPYNELKLDLLFDWWNSYTPIVSPALKYTAVVSLVWYFGCYVGDMPIHKLKNSTKSSVQLSWIKRVKTWDCLQQIWLISSLHPLV